jgi:uncharacterized membrane protein
MSLFRFARATSLLYLAGRYRQRLYLLILLLVFAATTAWLYGDIAAYLREHHPHLEVYALIVKTLAVYGALACTFWVLRPRGETVHNEAEQPAAEQASRLETVASKQRLSSRYEAILDRKSTVETTEVSDDES